MAAPEEVFQSLLAGIAAGRWEELAALYAEDAVVEQPFAVPPGPGRLDGREAIDRHFRAAAGAPLHLVPRDVVVHHTADPEVVIAEYDYEGRVTAGDHPFKVSNVQVVRVRDGVIVHTRDYHDHLRLAQATGRLPGLLTALAAGDPRVSP